MEKLQEIIKYRFKDMANLQIALTHSSYTKENGLPRTLNNERLEFLGDAVLGAVIGKYLYNNMRDAEEGQMSKIKADIVRSKSLAYMAREIELGRCLNLGHGEKAVGGDDKESILENAMEALIGAIFLDGGFDKTEEVVLTLFKEQIQKAIKGQLHTDYKSAFQEKVQKEGNRQIEYRVVKETGKSHNKTFYVELILDGSVVGSGQGKSKKTAENQAAAVAIKNI